MRKWLWVCCLLWGSISLVALAKQSSGEMIIENAEFRLTLTAGARARSLVHKASGQECLVASETPAFTLTQYRPYNNELQLAYPAKSTAFPADSVRREGDLLIVNFGIVDKANPIRGSTW